MGVQVAGGGRVRFKRKLHFLCDRGCSWNQTKGRDKSLPFDHAEIVLPGYIHGVLQMPTLTMEPGYLVSRIFSISGGGAVAARV